MKLIPLTRGLSAVVDDDAYEALSKHKWHAVPAGRKGVTGFYAVRGVPNGTPSTVYMHRQVAGAEQGQMVDHIDRDGLNNQSANLRFCTHTLNLGNTRRENVSGFRGVYWHRAKRRWYAQLQFEGKRYCTKRFKDPVDAAKAYDALAQQYFGAFATLNFPSAANDFAQPLMETAA